MLCDEWSFDMLNACDEDIETYIELKRQEYLEYYNECYGDINT